MKTVSIAFHLTLDVACSDETDPAVLADEFLQGDRFSVYDLNGEPNHLGIAGASSNIADIREFPGENTIEPPC